MYRYRGIVAELSRPCRLIWKKPSRRNYGEANMGMHASAQNFAMRHAHRRGGRIAQAASAGAPASHRQAPKCRRDRARAHVLVCFKIIRASVAVLRENRGAVASCASAGEKFRALAAGAPSSTAARRLGEPGSQAGAAAEEALRIRSSPPPSARL